MLDRLKPSDDDAIPFRFALYSNSAPRGELGRQTGRVHFTFAADFPGIDEFTAVRRVGQSDRRLG